MAKVFSIILPVYHQADQIQLIVKNYTTSLRTLKMSYELLLIINGNDRSSYEAAKKLTKDNPTVKIVFLKEAGWGNAVLVGLQKAQGKLVCYTNSARTRLEDLLAILRFAEKNPTIVIKATRMLHISPLRKIGSTLYNIECRILLHTPVWDVNGTPKVIPKSVVKKLHLESKDDVIDAELVAKCIALHIPILEVPILFPPRFGGSSTTNYLSAFKMYTGVLRIRKMLQNMFPQERKNDIQTPRQQRYESNK